MKILFAFMLVASFATSTFAATVDKPMQVLKCKDGSTTVVANRSGACSSHGGIDPKIPSNAPPPK